MCIFLLHTWHCQTVFYPLLSLNMKKGTQLTCFQICSVILNRFEFQAALHGLHLRCIHQWILTYMQLHYAMACRPKLLSLKRLFDQSKALTGVNPHRGGIFTSMPTRGLITWFTRDNLPTVTLLDFINQSYC